MLTLLPHVAALVAAHLAVASPRTSDDLAAPPRQPLPIGRPTTIEVRWENKVYLVPDAAKEGTPLPEIVGRLFLFDGDDRPVTCDGSVIVKLYNDAPTSGGAPVLLEVWNIDKDNLKTMMHKDIGAHSYNLFLPTAAWKPLLTKVHLTLTFVPDNGDYPLFRPCAPMRLNYAERQYPKSR